MGEAARRFHNATVDADSADAQEPALTKRPQKRRLKERRQGASLSRIDFLGFQFDPLDLQSAGQIVAARARAGGAFQYVVTPNAAIAVARRKEPEFFAPLLDGASLILNDSRVLEMLARSSGLALPVACGSDLTEYLFDEEIDPDEEIALIGGDPGVATAVARRYRLTKLRHYLPPMGLRANPAAVAAAAEFAAKTKARFTFIAVGCPQQEMIALAIKQRGDASGVGLCIGASLEFLAGAKQRAPKWMQRARLEWLHRLASEPGRLWRRYLLGVLPLLAAWFEWMRKKPKS